MASLVKQSSAQLALKFFLTASSDHIAGLTGLGAGATVTIRKEGGSFAAPAGAISEIANGWYQVAANATDTNTLGDILLHATGTGADPCDVVAATVVAFDPQDAAALGLSRIDAAISSRLATAGYTAPDNASIATILTDVNTGAGAIYNRLGAPAGASIAADIAAVKTDTGNLATRIPSAITITTGKVDVNDKTGFSLSAAGVKAIWDQLTSGLTTAGSIGKLLVDDLTAAIGSVAAAVWDVAIAGHLTAGTTGAALNAAGSAGDPWATPLPGAYGVGLAGNIVGNRLDAAVSSRLATAGYTAPDNASIATILTDVNTGAGAIYTRLGAPAGASIAADIAAVKTDTGNLATRIPSAITITTGKVDVNDKTGFALSSSEHNALSDAVLDRDMGAGADSGSPSVRTMRQALRFLRNKWAIVAGTLTVYKEDDATPSWSASVTTDAAANPITANDPA